MGPRSYRSLHTGGLDRPRYKAMVKIERTEEQAKEIANLLTSLLAITGNQEYLSNEEQDILRELAFELSLDAEEKF